MNAEYQRVTNQIKTCERCCLIFGAGSVAALVYLLALGVKWF
jgi:hypothetical protein